MLEVRGLTKRYGTFTAVSEVSFDLRPGEIVGYLGPNGSGKTTTFNMLTGLLQPTRGEVLLDGHDIHDDIYDYKRRIGYVPEEPNLYLHLNAYEYLELTGRLRSMPEEALALKIDRLLRLLSLGAQGRSSIASYSKGMKQKVLLASALLHNPDILILDEPFSGLDVTSALVLRSLIQSLARDGKIIVYSSHVLEVVEKLCSHVIIIHKGRIVANDSLERLRELMTLPSLEDVFSQLVVKEDTGRIADSIVEAMRTGAA